MKFRIYLWNGSLVVAFCSGIQSCLYVAGRLQIFRAKLSWRPDEPTRRSILSDNNCSASPCWSHHFKNNHTAVVSKLNSHFAPFSAIVWCGFAWLLRRRFVVCEGLAVKAIHGLRGETLINVYKFRRLHESLPFNIQYRMRRRKRSGRYGIV